MSARPVGLHTAVSGGLLKALARAEATGCDALQVFPSNPRGWALPARNNDSEAAMAEACATRGWPLFVHAPYLVNVASPDPLVFERSCECLRYALARSVRLGAESVVVHAGSALGTDRDLARARAADALRRLLDDTLGAHLSIELTAGGGERSLARHVPDVAALIDACDADQRIGVCLDSCHLWAAGVDWTSPRGLRELRSEVLELGPQRVRVVHVNDSHDPFGSARDHHANLGDGRIGLEPFRAFLRAPEWKHAPLICETPGTEERRAEDVAAVRTMLSRPLASRASRGE